MRVLAFLLASAVCISAAPVAAQAGPFEHDRVVADARLDSVRGGFLLPNGMDIGLGITLDTLVDGRLVLSTVLTIDDSAHLSIYAGGNLRPGGPATEILVPGANGASLVRITQSSSPLLMGASAQPLAVSANGAPVATQWGTVQLSQSDTQSTVILAGQGLEVRHMIGAITGALVANRAGNRVIDTVVTIDLDIRHSAIPTGAMMLGLDTLLTGAAARGAY
jgi:hypothetical protein